MESQFQSSAEIVASIAVLLTKILLCVPIKSLLRFKSVSKSWFHLISDPSFCRLIGPYPAAGLFLPSCAENPGEDNPSHEYEFVPFNPKLYADFVIDHMPSRLKILQSCSGLMLCCSKNTTTADTDVPEYCVYNPTTKKSSILPKPDKLTNGLSKRLHGIHLAFNPSKSSHYKIVSVFSLEATHYLQIIVYSSDSRSWRVQGQPFTCQANFEEGVYWNDAVHWMCISDKAESLYFNVEDLTHNRTPTLPLTYSVYCKRDYYFGESCDHLHFIDMRGPNTKLVVYELKRDYSEWLVKYNVDLSAVVVANPVMATVLGNPMFWCGFVFEVLIVVRGDKDEDSFLVLQIPGKVLRYNIHCKTFEDLVGRRRSLKNPHVHSFQYIQSLCCL